MNLDELLKPYWDGNEARYIMSDIAVDLIFRQIEIRCLERERDAFRFGSLSFMPHMEIEKYNSQIEKLKHGY